MTLTGSGGCTIARTPTGLGDYYSATCSIGGLQPNQSVQITATVEINESMDLKVEGAKVTTLVDTPPEYSGSKKVKIAGLPDGCVSKDFTLKASAKGAEKVFAKIRGPFHADGSPEAGELTKRYLNEREDGSKLTARVDKLDARLHSPRRRAAHLAVAAALPVALAVPASAQAQTKSCFSVDPDEPNARCVTSPPPTRPRRRR